MEKPYILHMLTPAKNVSPFDVNMALDAGWTAVVPYTHVDLDDVGPLVQDAIFSRGPNSAKRTGIFLGGRDLHIAMDMLDGARESMLPPFEVSVFADPSGAFTTAAALVAVVERQLQKSHSAALAGQRILILGGTGPVGAAAAILAAKAGAEVVILGRHKDRADRVAAICNHNYGSDLTGIRGDANDHKAEQFRYADVVLGTAKAGIQVMSAAEVAIASRLKVAADVNAVPPAGIAGVGLQDDGTPLPDSPGNAVAVGALAIGNVKYKTQHHLFRRMRDAEKPQYLHFEHAFEFARQSLHHG